MISCFTRSSAHGECQMRLTQKQILSLQVQSFVVTIVYVLNIMKSHYIIIHTSKIDFYVSM